MSSNETFGLTDSDVRVALCALKVMLIDGTSKVEKDHLARLTGHKNADSANRVWYMAKAKLMKDSPSESGTAPVNADTPTKGTKRTAAKMRTPNQKKRVAKEESEGEEAGEEEAEQPAKKRAKKAAPKDAASDADVNGEV